MSKANSTASLDGLPLRNLKCSLDTGEDARQKLTRPSGALVEDAMNVARLAPKQLADAMGVSTSFLLRGFKDQEHISWQRINLVENDAFHEALITAHARQRKLATVRTVIEFPAKKESA